MILKTSVISVNVHPATWYAIGIAEMIYSLNGVRMVVTSLTDGHADKPGSLHPKGLAVDFRIKNIPEPTLVRSIHGNLVSVLNPMGYDVVLEKDHIHVEWDDKHGKPWQTAAP